MSSQREYHSLRSMQPRLTSHSSEARSSTIGKAITLPEPCSIAQVRSQAGALDGVRFM
jgi:hypothetical protein